MNSMTGFGNGQAEHESLGSLAIELRSVNSRFLDLAIRLPQELTTFEPLARSELQKRFARGKIYLSTRFDPIPGAAERYLLNEPLLKKLEEFCEERGATPSAESLLGIEGVIQIQPDESRQDELKKLFIDALEQAAEGLDAERGREGAALRQALLEIHEQMRERLDAVEESRGQVVDKFRERLHERLDELLGPKSASLDPGRLEQEVAIFADKADISEEIMRLGAHLDRLKEILNPENPEVKGRALDFLAQEILREINTIGSKARDLDITRQVLELKGLVESLKEQIANVE